MKTKKQREFFSNLTKEFRQECSFWKVCKWGDNDAQATIHFRTIPFAKEDGMELSFDGQITFQDAVSMGRIFPKSKGKFNFGTLSVSYTVSVDPENDVPKWMR